MNKIYEINYGNKHTVPMAQYENQSPMFNIKVIIEGAERIHLGKELKKIAKIVDMELHEKVRLIKQEQLVKALKHLRFYEKNGKQYPSVTSIINPEPYLADPLYGERGDLLHELFASNQYDYEFTPDEEVKYASIGGIRQYTLKWIKEDTDIEFDKSEVEVFHDKEMYAGRYDRDGLYKGKVAIYDLKTGVLNKAGQEKAFMQLSAYAKATGLNVENLVILPCGPKVKNLPIVSTDVEKYFSMFIEKRIAFKERFGI